MTVRIPASLKFTVPVILLAFVAALSSVNVLYHVPKAERMAEEDARKHANQNWRELNQHRSRTSVDVLLAGIQGDAVGSEPGDAYHSRQCPFTGGHPDQLAADHHGAERDAGHE